MVMRARVVTYRKMTPLSVCNALAKERKRRTDSLINEIVKKTANGSNRQTDNGVG